MTLSATSAADKHSDEGPVIVDVHQLKLSGAGAESFCWPLDRKELLTMRDSLTVRFVGLLRQALTAKAHGAPALTIVSHVLIMECMALYQARALTRRYRLRGHEIRWPEGYRLWEALAGERMPKAPGFVLNLEKGPARRNRLMDEIAPLARKLRGGSRLKHLQFRRRCPSSGIVTTRFDNQILVAHAAMADEPVTHVHFSAFFGQPVRRDPEATALDPDLLEAMTGLVDESFRAGTERLTALDREYIAMSVERSVAAATGWMNGLDQQADRLPRQLWTGTGGNLWDRMLRWAVRRAGGHVTGHDHATGHGHLRHPLNYLVEFVACDRFMTDHPSKVAAAKDQALPELLPEQTFPEIVSLPARYTQEIERLSQAKNAGGSGERRVMYVAALYTGENLHLLPYPPDLSMVDWQARLLAKLRGWGYDIIHQAHPEGATKPPQRLTECSGKPPSSGRFEENFDPSNILVFDYFLQTTLGRALRTRAPIVLIDFGHVELLCEAEEKLARRCAIVKARTGLDNRFYVDWNDLQAALERAPSLIDDHSFLHDYLQQSPA